MCPLEKGVRGIETGIIRCRAGVAGRAAFAAMESHAEMARAAARSPREDQALSLVFYWDSVPKVLNPPTPFSRERSGLRAHQSAGLPLRCSSAGI